MKKEYDFSNGVRGKFFNADAELNLPMYLDPEIQKCVAKLADEKRVDRSSIVNMLLKKDKELMDS
jgi:hypothetical protein